MEPPNSSETSRRRGGEARWWQVSQWGAAEQSLFAEANKTIVPKESVFATWTCAFSARISFFVLRCFKSSTPPPQESPARDHYSVGVTSDGDNPPFRPCVGLVRHVTQWRFNCNPPPNLPQRIPWTESRYVGREGLASLVGLTLTWNVQPSNGESVLSLCNHGELTKDHSEYQLPCTSKLSTRRSS